MKKKKDEGKNRRFTLFEKLFPLIKRAHLEKSLTDTAALRSHRTQLYVERCLHNLSDLQRGINIAFQEESEQTNSIHLVYLQNIAHFFRNMYLRLKNAFKGLERYSILAIDVHQICLT